MSIHFPIKNSLLTNCRLQQETYIYQSCEYHQIIPNKFKHNKHL